MEAVRAEVFCALGERFGCPPHEVALWPAATFRMVEADVLMRKARQARAEKEGGGGG